MANPSVLAQGLTDATPNEGNGIAGPTKAQITAGATLPYAVVTGTLAGDDRYATKTTAIRHSVAKTSGGSTASEVYSETMALRFAYPDVESDSPAIKEASGDADRTA
tara:strand:+ start:1476 stop:1796 length:321 start_codon:yes stop_codon:yes gene_type:complete